MRFHLFFLLFLFPVFLAAQEEKHPKADSLLRVIEEMPNDTSRIRVMNKLFLEYQRFDSEKALIIAKDMLASAEAIPDTFWITVSYDNIAHMYWMSGDQPSALTFLQKKLEIVEKKGNKAEIASCYNNIGVVYRGTKNLDQALFYFRKANALSAELHDSLGMASSYSNIGLIYDMRGDERMGLWYYNQSLRIRRKMHDVSRMATIYTNIGAAYIGLNVIDSARMEFDTSLALNRQLGDLPGIATCYQNLGSVYHSLGDDEKAILYQDSAIYLARKSGKLEVIVHAYEDLAKLEEDRGNYKAALEWFRKKTALSDSLFNVNVSGQVAEMEAKYHSVKKQRENDQLKTSLAEEETQRLYSVLIAGMALLIAGALLYAYRNKRKSNLLLTEQKAHIETQKQEITDSITYAQRIQQAIFPEAGLLNSIFPEAFVLYLPKAIVSGDFWWLHSKSGDTWIVVGDCTGHGVPGAFMSMLGVDKLNSLVQEDLRPAELLSRLNRSVKETLHQSNEIISEDVRDGMDIAFAVFSPGKQQLLFSGANRPLWVISRNGEWHEEKPTKVSIGGHTSEKQEFQLSTIPLKEGDTVYLFTDGYADQFGGPEEKKIMTRRMRQWLGEIQHLPMKAQQEEMKKRFLEWRGPHEQIDDVLLIGIRV